MNRNTLRTSASALLAAGALALPLAAPAHATGGAGGRGTADAVVLSAGLGVDLLDKTVRIPIDTTLNEVTAPASARKTALTVTVDSQPVSLLKAAVADAKAEVVPGRSAASVTVADATVHVPGLSALPLLKAEKITAEAVCETGAAPRAKANVLGSVTVLGKRVTLSAGGPTVVDVPGVGKVTLALSGTETTDTKGAATALRLAVDVNPLKLNIAEVKGEIVLARARCQAPAGTEPSVKPSVKPSAKPTPAASVSAAVPNVRPQTGGEDLAETGAGTVTPWVAGGALLLLGLGGGAMYLTRRGRA
ncbi:SCO1860 family LAETG-anchored protein [Streptomyces sp. BI20]|uniref:SCO1860 family LAETG-anchored protein n=1 Tax=Streptomyces sp. BI20 TaxID=3403460 RepID=UPI003C74D0D6